MNQYIMTEDGFKELDAYFFEQKDPGVTTLWINLKNKEFQRYNPQSGQCPHWLIGRVAGVDGDTNEYFCNANPQAEREKVLDLIESFRKINSKEYTIYSLWVMEAQYLQELRSKQEQP